MESIITECEKSLGLLTYVQLELHELLCLLTVLICCKVYAGQ